MSEDWDIEAYKTEHETDEHWELKKKFMLTHKDKFPEDELVCLAQVFANIEFMGCRYPDQTMIRVAELAKGVVEKYREERKNAIKRTFVAASDAASAKVKGQASRGEDSTPPTKIRKIDSNKINSDNNGEGKPKSNTARRYGGVKTFEINPKDFEKGTKKVCGPLGNFVLLLNKEDHPVSTIQRSAGVNKCEIRWDFQEGAGALKVCKLYLNKEFIAMGVGENTKSSKENTALAGINKLRETYYTINIKSRYFSDTTVASSHIKTASENPSTNALGEDNIGRKLLKLMGWQGGGLGSKEQGIEEPIAASVQVGREGFSQGRNNSNLEEFKRKAKDYIQTWMNSDSHQDLVFSSDFSSEERKAMHEIASFFSLKSKSYGKDANRQLVISRKADPWEIVQELKRIGGSTDKYELLYPTNNSRFYY